MTRLMDVVTDRGVQASAAAAVILGAGSIVRPLPWWLWAAWSLVTVWAVFEAVNDE